jgi:tyrosyl-tRNA synthetase
VGRGLADGALDPWAEKRRMAREVVDLYHGPGEGAAAERRFERVHRDRDLPEDVAEIPLPPDAVRDGAVFVPTLLVTLGFASSNSDARRKLEQDGVRVDGEVVREQELPLERLRGRVISVGRRLFARLV